MLSSWSNYITLNIVSTQRLSYNARTTQKLSKQNALHKFTHRVPSCCAQLQFVDWTLTAIPRTWHLAGCSAVLQRWCRRPCLLVAGRKCRWGLLFQTSSTQKDALGAINPKT